MIKDRGFTLVELLTVLAILAILVALAVPNMTNLVRKNRIENQTRRIHSDLMNTRVRAMNVNRMHCLVFQPDNYQVVADTNGNGQCDAIPADTQVLVRSGIDVVPYSFTGGIPGNETITENLGGSAVFNGRGLAINQGAVCVTAPNVQPNRNCIVINPTWIRVGKLQLGAACDAANCDTSIRQ